MHRIFQRILAVFLVLLLLFWGAWIAMGSQPVLKWAFGIGQNIAADFGLKLSSKEIDGHLLRGVELKNLQLQSEGGLSTIQLANARIAYSPISYLKGNLELFELKLSGLEAKINADTTDHLWQLLVNPPESDSKLNFKVDQLEIDSSSIQLMKGTQQFALRDINAMASIGRSEQF